jgi:hypothetical protein
MFLSPQFLSVRMIIRTEFQKSYKSIENIFYLTKNPSHQHETGITKTKIYKRKSDLFYLNLFLSPFSMSSKILFKEHMYKGIPIARKTYSFLTTVMSPKIMYKLGRISSNDAQTPTYGFDIIF